MITCPDDMIFNTAEVSYTNPSATDNLDSNPMVSCAPQSESSSFVMGENTVTCTATDQEGNTARCTFTVTVGTYHSDVCL